MSDHEQFPAFAGSGDSQEEALWQAYQAMLRRRNERRAGGSAMEDPRNSADRPPSARRIEARGGRAPSIKPDSLAAQVAEVHAPDSAGIESLRRPHSRTRPTAGGEPTRTGRGARRRGGAGRRGRARSRAVAPQPRPEIPGCNGRAGKHAAAATGRQLGAPTNSALLRRGAPSWPPDYR